VLKAGYRMPLIGRSDASEEYFPGATGCEPYFNSMEHAARFLLKEINRTPWS
jgi:hypothetical protein